MAQVFGLDVVDLPEDFIATEVLVVVRGLNAQKDGGVQMCTRTSSGLSTWDIAGMAACTQAYAVQQYCED